MVIGKYEGLSMRLSVYGITHGSGEGQLRDQRPESASPN